VAVGTTAFMLTWKMMFLRPTGPGCTQGMNWIEAGASLE
jgi:hypothetical protein